MRTYDLTDAELDNYMYEQDLMKSKNLARYLKEEIAKLENMLAGYTAKRAELKAQHQSTREVAKHIRDCKKYIKADQEKFAEIQF